MRGRVLIVAGSDSGGGAGIQADIKTVTALDGYAATAITALTAQDTHTVHAIHEVPVDFIAHQMRLSFADIGVDCVKTGMLHSAEVIDAVAGVLVSDGSGVPLVVDPVMVAKGGARLLQPDTEDVLSDRLLPLATVLTPNLPEAAAQLGREIATLQDMLRAAPALLQFGSRAVLLKGGHLAGERLYDVLAVSDGREEVFESAYQETPHTHGTGCTLASAIATGLAQGMDVRDAVARARDYVAEAIRTAPGFGGGHGPLNHAHTVGG